MSTTPAPAPGPAPAPAPGPAPAPAPSSAPMVEKVHFDRVVAAKTGLEARVAELTAQVGTLQEKASTVDTLAGQVQEWKGKAEAAESRFETFTSVSKALGTSDKEVVDLALWHHDRLPAEGRPAVGEWLDGLKAKPDSAPVTLRSFLSNAPAPAPGAAPAPAPGAAPAPAPPRNPAGAARPPGSPSNITREQLRAAKEKGVKTGDWSDYKKLAEAAGLRTADRK